MNTTDTSWIVAGTEVLVYTPRTSDGYTNSCLTTIKKVAAKSFTVEDTSEPRFDLATHEYWRSRGWSQDIRRVVPLDSGEARGVMAVDERRKATLTARVACSEYDRNPTSEHRLSAIDALQAVED